MMAAIIPRRFDQVKLSVTNDEFNFGELPDQ